MEYLPFFLIGLIIAVQLFVVWSAKRFQGLSVSELAPLLPEESDEGRRLLYFSSENCLPCRTVTPMVRSLSERFPQVSVLDIEEHADLARGLGIRGTPTFILLDGERVERVLLGALSRQRLERLLLTGR